MVGQALSFDINILIVSDEAHLVGDVVLFLFWQREPLFDSWLRGRGRDSCQLLQKKKIIIFEKK